ncbi:MAG: hypothetical protein HYS27_23840 [Deltaproteobacteria bacterium]|nr:hypothetical protein [Deltaproteobacteria bacterium]
MTSAERAPERPDTPRTEGQRAEGQRTEPQRSETSPPVRLPKGEIPSTWSRPAEQVSQVPIRAPRPLTSAFIVVGGAVVGFLLAVWLAPARQQGAQPSPEPAPPPVAVVEPPPTVVATPAAVAIADTPPPTAIPEPPPTSSTKPGDVAPEDQGGDQGGDLAETPARAKAKQETVRAKALFASGELVTAEAPLIRATLGDPSYPDAWVLLGTVRDQLGNAEGAKRAYKRYLQLAPTAPDARAVRAALAALAALPQPAPAAPPAGPASPDPAGN